MAAWRAVDLDGTLAMYHGWDGGKIGEPIPRMVARVKRWIEDDGPESVRIFTARVSPPAVMASRAEGETDLDAEIRIMEEIQDWAEKHIGYRLRVTCQKDFHCVEIWDDRAMRVETNTGEIEGTEFASGRVRQVRPVRG